MEMLVGLAILSLLLVLLLGVMNQTSSAVRRTAAQVDAFQQARTAFDIMVNSLSQATLNTYWDYYDAAGIRRTPANAALFQPARYGRASDLHFVIRQNGDFGQAVFFTGPLAFSPDGQKAQTQGLLNACGYFVEFGDPAPYQPSLFPSDSRSRFRLMQSLQATEDFTVFGGTDAAWTTAVAGQKWPIASNVIALVVQPRLSSAEDAAGTAISDQYTYDSRTGTEMQRAQLPPVLQLTMVVIDKASADRPGIETAISYALAGKFTDPLKYASDLRELEDALTAERVNYQVFTTAVPLRESKWSSS